MALINVHPDYLAFTGPGGKTEFPIRHYEEFLSYVSSRYKDSAWFALPREVAQFTKETLSSPTVRATIEIAAEKVS